MDISESDGLRAEIHAACLRDERECSASMQTEMQAAHSRVAVNARAYAIDLINGIRDCEKSQTKLASVLHEYDLSSREGILLMCLAEALLRIPDNDTANHFIHDIIIRGGWENHLGGDRSLFVIFWSKVVSR
jgi:RHH-type proline utilization regulon transcriptional repressor/proline dehydrogenase/delta 1-pyrroline-5-carboxylate dehydrogenase